ncbi:hypothetical protein Harreka1_59 [Olleya phage Harreka_1]|uniref:Uncharacterized protein n=1 Tax=Olleya phage Harreka_1 TaxID=2745673 RepID=A0A8E4ZJV3_9CAUD|nr:hypothetical protein M1M26_gp59 [Olleya phage Harreka_1]QQV90466.1 hypothetical protein Harreka1_59 [Olleya phage Harreka_1]
MTSHELAIELLKGENFKVTASIDISTNDKNNDRRIFTKNCLGVNNFNGDNGVITILFDFDLSDNHGNKL